MATPKLEFICVPYRKRSGLTQREVAFLLGCQNGAQVSRYERRRRLPPLGTAFAWEAIFGVPASELFDGLRENIGEDIKKRLLELRSKLEKGGMKGNELYLAAQSSTP
jgi:transcriptional regulator with XRE-family HTH domain